MLKNLLRLLAIGAFIALAVSAYFYFKVLSPTVVPADAEEVIVHIPSNKNFEAVVAILDAAQLIPDHTAFDVLAERMNYKKDKMRSGRFAISPGSTMVDMIRLLRNGKQAPVKLVLTTEREPINVAAKAARFIEPDSTAIAELLTNQAFIDSIGYSKETLMSLFIPNTYEFFWDVTPRDFVNRMLKEHDRFWDSDGRRAKAQKLDLSPNEVYTLSSIIEKETQQNVEKRRMAGVYHNRVLRGMLLQADPTAVFASRDFYTRRVTNRHLLVDSPYNTYMYPGLPPGPIAMASIASIDATLNREQHDYIFFCAKGDGSGLHNFAETLSGHNRNVATYKANLRARGLR